MRYPGSRAVNGSGRWRSSRGRRGRCRLRLPDHGSAHHPASISGFITGLLVVLTPLVAAVLLRERPSRWSWLAVALATLGLALLSLRGFSLGVGEVATAICAPALATHIVGVSRWSGRYDVYALVVVQLATVTCVSAVLAGERLGSRPAIGAACVLIAMVTVAHHAGGAAPRLHVFAAAARHRQRRWSRARW
jgi:uncharacterized membrane protein